MYIPIAVSKRYLLRPNYTTVHEQKQASSQDHDCDDRDRDRNGAFAIVGTIVGRGLRRGLEFPILKSRRLADKFIPAVDARPPETFDKTLHALAFSG